jgi:hypothetical protein
MQQILIVSLSLCGLWPLSLLAQIGIADPVTGNAIINFYGRAVDQEGKPLAGAKATLDVYTGSATEGRMKHEETTFLTDADGRFTLTGVSGHSVKIVSIDKDGYELSKTITRLYPYSWSAGIFQPDPKNPVQFVLWDKGRKKELISVDKHFNFIPDGRSYAVDFSKHTIAQATNSEGDIQFRLTRPKGEGKANRFDWSFSVDVRNGNFIAPVDQDYFAMTFPPNSGYTNKYQEIYQISDQSWKQAGWKQFYIKMQNGQSYAKMALIWDAVAAANGPKTNDAGIRIQYTLNPDGSALTE